MRTIRLAGCCFRPFRWSLPVAAAAVALAAAWVRLKPGALPMVPEGLGFVLSALFAAWSACRLHACERRYWAALGVRRASIATAIDLYLFAVCALLGALSFGDALTMAERGATLLLIAGLCSLGFCLLQRGWRIALGAVCALAALSYLLSFGFAGTWLSNALGGALTRLSHDSALALDAKTGIAVKTGIGALALGLRRIVMDER